MASYGWSWLVVVMHDWSWLVMVDLVSIGLLWFDMVSGLWFVVHSYCCCATFLAATKTNKSHPKINGWKMIHFLLG